MHNKGVYMIIGFAGYAQSGKDTAVREYSKLLNLPCGKLAFANKLKQDLTPLVKIADQYSPHHVGSPEFKEIFRPLMVEYSKFLKVLTGNERIWTLRLKSEIDKSEAENAITFISDVRYSFEVDYIYSRGGIVIRIFRDFYGPRNEEERMSFAEIEKLYPNIPVIYNNGTEEELGLKIKDLLV